MNLPPNFLLAPLAAALPDHPRWTEVIGYQVNGLIVVFVALGLIWGMLEIMGLFFRRAGLKSEPASVVVPVTAAAPVVADDVTEEQLAAISAAIEFTFGPNHRIEAIIPADPVLNWAQEGRRQIFASHKTR